MEQLRADLAVMTHKRPKTELPTKQSGVTMSQPNGIDRMAAVIGTPRLSVPAAKPADRERATRRASKRPKITTEASAS